MTGHTPDETGRRSAAFLRASQMDLPLPDEVLDIDTPRHAPNRTPINPRRPGGVVTDQADTGPIAHRREGGHWLVFNMRALSGPVTGCHCGFVAELDADGGWGDSVLDHFETVVRAETADEVRALRAENQTLSGELVTMSAGLVNVGLYGARVAKERDSALAELAAARDQIAAVVALHQPGKNIIVWSYRDDEGVTTRPAQQCNGCSRGDELCEWPCPTIAALSQSGQPTKGASE